MENTSKKNNVIKGVGVAAAGAVLLGGLATYASWSDSADVDGGIIQSGQLAVESTGTSVQDVTEYRADSPHDINLTTWKAVPGDSVQLTVGLDTALEGDNLLAELDASVLEAVISEDNQDYVTYDLELQDADGNVITPNEEGVYLLEAQRDGQGSTTTTEGAFVSGAELDATADVNAVVTVNFSADTPEQVLTETNLATVEDGSVTLTQVFN